MKRRTFLAKSSAALAAAQVAPLFAADAGGPRQATGVKAGEVTDTTAIVWTRLTAQPRRNTTGPLIRDRVKKGVKVEVSVPVGGKAEHAPAQQHRRTQLGQRSAHVLDDERPSGGLQSCTGRADQVGVGVALEPLAVAVELARR